MKKWFNSFLALAILVVMALGSTIALAVYDEEVPLTFQVTINGEVFEIDNMEVPHDQSDALGTVNIPLKLGEFNAPVSLELEDLSTETDLAYWDVTSCRSTLASSSYYIEPDNYDTLERDSDETITEDAEYYIGDTYENYLELELTMPNCYEISFKGKDSSTNDYNIEEDIYFVVNALDGYIEPDFEMSFEHSDISIFDEERNETPVVLAPEFITLTNASNEIDDVELASLEWTIEWADLFWSEENQGQASLPISNSDKVSEEFSYDFNNPGAYQITLETTGTNGLTYESSKRVLVHPSEDYFRAVLTQRDSEGKDFDDFLDTVEDIDDEGLRELYETALDGCEYVYTQQDATTGGWALSCENDVYEDFEIYDADLYYLDVPCSTFPDLGGYNSYDEICRAAEVVKEVEAFQGDGAGSPTEGYLRPDDNINRIEICAVLNKSKISTANNIVPDSVDNSAYSDLQGLDDTDWRKTNAAACDEFSGYPDGTFQAANDINMVEALKVLLGLYEADVEDSDADVLNDYCPSLNEDDWYAKYLGFSFENGFMENIEDSCDAGKDLTRGEVITIMYRMFYEFEYIAVP